MEYRKFICECGHVFNSSVKCKFENHKKGSYWFTAQGYVAKCPKCGGYAIEKTCLNMEDIKNYAKMNHKLGTEIMREALYGDEAFKELVEEAEKIKQDYVKELMLKKEEHTMYDSITVSCSGFTGELKMLVKTAAGSGYNLSIRDTENAVTHVLEHVKPNEIKLVSGRVTMGG